MHLEQMGVNPAEHQQIAKALAKSVAKQVSPIAKSMYPAGVSGPSVLDEEVLPSSQSGGGLQQKCSAQRSPCESTHSVLSSACLLLNTTPSQNLQVAGETLSHYSDEKRAQVQTIISSSQEGEVELKVAGAFNKATDLL